MEFQFGIPSHVTFGRGSVKKVGEVLEEFNAKKVLCVYDQGVKQAGIVGQVITYLKAKKIEVVEFANVVPNPPDTILEEGAELAVKEQVEAIVAVGGEARSMRQKQLTC